MEHCVKTYNVGAQSREGFSKFLTDIKDYLHFDDEDKNTWFNRATNCWFKADKQQEYAFNKKDFQRSYIVFKKLPEIYKTLNSIRNQFDI